MTRSAQGSGPIRGGSTRSLALPGARGWIAVDRRRPRWWLRLVVLGLGVAAAAGLAQAHVDFSGMDLGNQQDETWM